MMFIVRRMCKVSLISIIGYYEYYTMVRPDYKINQIYYILRALSTKNYLKEQIVDGAWYHYPGF